MVQGVDRVLDHGAHTHSGPRADRERMLLSRYHHQGDLRARDRLAEEMLPLARALAGRYAGRGEPLDDLVQVACVGIMKAIEGFDLEREVRFSSYATPTVLGEIKRHFRDKTWAVRVPRGTQELGDAAAFAERLRAEVAAESDEATAAAYEQGMPPDQQFAGMERALRGVSSPR